MGADQYDLPPSGMEATMVEWVTEALELRHGSGEDPEGKLTDVDPSEGIEALMALLSRVRMRADRVDELMSKATRARSRFRRVREEANFAAELAYDEATRKNKTRRSFDDYATKDERKADASLLSLDEKRAAHEAKRLVSFSEEAYEVITQIHWQLDAIRKDLRAALHALQFESKLEN